MHASWPGLRIAAGLAAAFAAGAVGMFAVAPPGPPVPPPAPPPSPPAKIDSIFVDLALERHTLETTRPGTGGGIAELDGRPLVVSHDGVVAVLADGALVPSAIRPPENGFAALAAYLETEEAKAAGRTVRLDWFRYMDLLATRWDGRDRLAISYTEWQPENACYVTAVATLDLPEERADPAALAAEPADWEVVFRTAPCLPMKDRSASIEAQMGGGRMADLGQGRVALSSGDYSWDGVYGRTALAQGNNDYGKVLEIGLSGGTSRRLATGLSNPQGLAADAEGRIWAVDHGRRGGDELNLVTEGANFGWPEATLGTDYDRKPWPGEAPYGRHDGYDLPVWAWLPSVAVSSLDLVEGFHPAWDGDLIAGSLKDQSLHRIRIRQGRAVFAERIPVGDRVRSVRMLSDGRLAWWTDWQDLVIARPVARDFELERVLAMADAMPLAPGDSEALLAAIQTCAHCHRLDAGPAAGAPSLATVVGRPVAATDFEFHSPALQRLRGEVWDENSLAEYLADPQGFAEGTIMPATGLEEGPVLDAMIEVLRRLPEAQVGAEAGPGGLTPAAPAD